MSLSAILDALAKQLYPVSVPIAEALSLVHLPPHFPTLLLAFVYFKVIEWISPVLFARLYPVHFGRASPSAKHSWTTHAVSMAHVFLVIPLAISCLDLPELDKDRAFGHHPRAGHLHAIAVGYDLLVGIWTMRSKFNHALLHYPYYHLSFFLWDILDCIFHFHSIGFLMHATVCLTVFSRSFCPFLEYYGVRFLFWELSTPFLNIHWFLDKTNRTGGILQVINGIILTTTFFLVRLCFGGWMSLDFFHTLRNVRSEIHPLVILSYTLGNFILQGLNWFWFYKMLLALYKRFSLKQSSQLNMNGNLHINGKKKQ